MKINNQKAIWGLAVLPAVLGCYLLAISMRRGPGVGGDATIYITAARNLLAGKGLGLINPAGEFRLLPYFPPFYPLLLAFFGWLGLDPAGFAGPLNIILFAATVFAVAKTISQCAEKWIAGLLAGTLLATSPILIPVYSWAMSEPLSIALMAIGFLTLAQYLSTGRRSRLFISAVSCGLSFLTRYSMAACLICACLILLFAQKKQFRIRLSEAVVYGLIAFLPMLIWLIYDIRMTSTVASRSILENVNLWEEIRRFNSQLQPVFLQWLLPDSFINSQSIPVWIKPIVYSLILVFPFIICIAVLHQNTDNLNDRILNFLSLIFCSFFYIYLFVILLTSVTTYPPITIGSRMLSPAHFSFLCLIGSVYARLLRHRQNSSGLKYIITFCLIGLAATYGLRSIRIARQNAIDGLGYNSVKWRESETVAYIRDHIPPEQLIVTNEETALLFLLNRITWPIHEVYVNQPDEIFYAYESQNSQDTDAGRSAFQRGEAFLVVFDTFEDQMRDIYGQDTQKRIEALFKNLKVVADTDDGVIYTLNKE
ncbi:MAG TPA: glycosyltransferase family 39 protein [Flexilinea sp.]|nr:glycosyltransferase family 39 protein [Flexilinea sp.]HOW06206.1 glycosyltransferase family 39 protein [Flexilinea sp.]HPS48219.1 glycosyltransferase family 39 protein [Flexilinea sp.]